ncbi:hypothetical protein [Treponema endosymbiont of Eucomonympha sp.]|uniref:hypothetical protein n=1 Tax=Treponema endosymbiont of Eucomonympha sp. TaxID=1580831 RepID=UPI0013969F9D|nr:hypothetical protein [Treponema endosymbiont of Eucomonympha sp.]
MYEPPGGFYASLIKSYESLRGFYAWLIKSYESLRGFYASLIKSYESLRGFYESLIKLYEPPGGFYERLINAYKRGSRGSGRRAGVCGLGGAAAEYGAGFSGCFLRPAGSSVYCPAPR